MPMMAIMASLPLANSALSFFFFASGSAEVSTSSDMWPWLSKPMTPMAFSVPEKSVVGTLRLDSHPSLVV